MTTTTTIKTKTKAPFVIVYVGPKGCELAGYAYTVEAATKRARRMGFRYKVLPVIAGKVEVPLPAPEYHLCLVCGRTRIFHAAKVCGPCTL